MEVEIAEVKAISETRFTLLMWFLGILGALCLLVAGGAVNVGLELNKSVQEFGVNQVRITTTLEMLVDEMSEMKDKEE
jgi:hypothetical protein